MNINDVPITGVRTRQYYSSSLCGAENNEIRVKRIRVTLCSVVTQSYKRYSN